MVLKHAVNIFIKNLNYCSNNNPIFEFLNRWSLSLQAEKSFVLNKHNELRRQVAQGLEPRGANGSGPQPKAADMYKLVWDPVVARMAQGQLVLLQRQ